MAVGICNVDIDVEGRESEGEGCLSAGVPSVFEKGVSEQQQGWNESREGAREER
jgi:hypothetical protein